MNWFSRRWESRSMIMLFAPPLEPEQRCGVAAQDQVLGWLVDIRSIPNRGHGTRELGVKVGVIGGQADAVGTELGHGQRQPFLVRLASHPDIALDVLGGFALQVGGGP